MDVLKRSRRVYEAHLVKKINELDAKLTVVQVKLEMIQKSDEKIDTLDKDILVVVNRDGSEEEQDDELLSVSEYEERYRTAKVRRDNFLDDKAASPR